jgi:hypothetical protein
LLRSREARDTRNDDDREAVNDGADEDDRHARKPDITGKRVYCAAPFDKLRMTVVAMAILVTAPLNLGAGPRLGVRSAVGGRTWPG